MLHPLSESLTARPPSPSSAPHIDQQERQDLLPVPVTGGPNGLTSASTLHTSFALRRRSAPLLPDYAPLAHQTTHGCNARAGMQLWCRSTPAVVVAALLRSTAAD